MATRYFVNGGVDNNWGTTGNWSTSSGGVGGSSVPTSADDVFFTASSPNCTVNASARACRALDCTGYNGTITLSQSLTVNVPSAGVCTFSATTVFAGSGTLVISVGSTSGTVTSNGITIPNPVDFSTNSGTVVLADIFRVSGLLRFTTSNGTHNGFSIQASGGFTLVTGNHGGTTELNFVGTGTISRTLGSIALPINLNTLGTLTFSGTFIFGGGTLTYVAGTIITTGSTLQLGTGATTIDTDGMTWNHVIIDLNTSTLTLLGNLDIGGDLSLDPSGTTLINGTFNVNVTGSLLFTAVGSTGGTSVLRLIGSGSVTFASGRTLLLPLVIDTAGTYVFTGPVSFGSLEVASGTVSGDVNISAVSGGGGAGMINLSGIHGPIGAM